MDDGARHCALAGCDEAVRVVTGRPERRYCTAAHRVAARQARRAATRGGRSAAPADPSRRGGRATAAGCAPAWPRSGPPRLLAPRDAGPDATVVALDERRELRVRGLAGTREGEQAAPLQATPRERARATMDRLRAQARRLVEEAGQARPAGAAERTGDGDVETGRSR
jgi:hypothetical protein